MYTKKKSFVLLGLLFVLLLSLSSVSAVNEEEHNSLVKPVRKVRHWLSNWYKPLAGESEVPEPAAKKRDSVTIDDDKDGHHYHYHCNTDDGTPCDTDGNSQNNSTSSQHDSKDSNDSDHSGDHSGGHHHHDHDDSDDSSTTTSDVSLPTTTSDVSLPTTSVDNQNYGVETFENQIVIIIKTAKEISWVTAQELDTATFTSTQVMTVTAGMEPPQMCNQQTTTITKTVAPQTTPNFPDSVTTLISYSTKTFPLDITTTTTESTTTTTEPTTTTTTTTTATTTTTTESKTHSETHSESKSHSSASSTTTSTAASPSGNAPPLSKQGKTGGSVPACYQGKEKGILLTQYWVPKEGDKDMLNDGKVVMLTGTANTPLKSDGGGTIAEVSKVMYQKCQMEGTCLLSNGKLVNLGDTNETFEVLDRTKTPYGIGDKGNSLYPYVSVASNDIKTQGQILYVKELDGVPLRTGYTHNGCVRVDDVGWSFGNCQLDFFVLQYEMYVYLDSKVPEKVTVSTKECTVLNYVTPSLQQWALLK